MKKVILSKPLILIILSSFLFYSVIPLYASTGKMRTNGLFIKKAKNRLFNKENTIPNINNFNNFINYQLLKSSPTFSINKL